MNSKNHKLSELFNQHEGPSIECADIHDGSAVIQMHVDTHLRWFDGHFPDQKVLPGVVQIDWAGKLGKALFIKEQTFFQLTNIKFKTMVLPGTAMRLELLYNADKGSLKFHFFSDNVSFSTGNFKFTTL